MRFTWFNSSFETIHVFPFFERLVLLLPCLNLGLGFTFRGSLVFESPVRTSHRFQKLVALFRFPINRHPVV